MIPVKMGTPRSHDGLTLFPLFMSDDPDAEGSEGSDGFQGSSHGSGGSGGSGTPWTLLADALGAGSLEVMARIVDPRLLQGWLPRFSLYPAAGGGMMSLHHHRRDPCI